MQPELLSHLIDTGKSYIVPLMISCLRVLGILQVFPLFFWLKLTGPMRLSLSLSLSIPVFGGLAENLSTIATFSTIELLWLASKEFIVGASFGLLVGLPFWGCQAAGDIVEIYRGGNVANASDPVNASPTSTMGQALLLISLGLFVSSDGLFVLVNLYFTSFAVWPITAPLPHIDPKALSLFAQGLVHLGEIGLVIGSPLILLMFFCEIALTFSGRSSKLSGLNDISSALKNLVLILLTPTYMIFLADYLRQHVFVSIQALFELVPQLK